MQVSRSLFDEVMVPNYAPSAVIPVKVVVPEYGIKMGASLSTSQAV